MNFAFLVLSHKLKCNILLLFESKPSLVISKINHKCRDKKFYFIIIRAVTIHHDLGTYSHCSFAFREKRRMFVFVKVVLEQSFSSTRSRNSLVHRQAEVNGLDASAAI